MITKDYILEIWVPVKGYEGLYEVSTLGRVKSLNYKKTGKERILSLCPDSKGYLRVYLMKDGKGKGFTVHRLVAIAFIPNPNNLPCVNHKNEIKTENWVILDDNGNIVDTNLEWCTYQYNNDYGTHYQRSSKSLTNRSDLAKPVQQFTKDGDFITEYPSALEAERQTGYGSRNIGCCCRGSLKTYKGFIWKYK